MPSVSSGGPIVVRQNAASASRLPPTSDRPHGGDEMAYARTLAARALAPCCPLWACPRAQVPCTRYEPDVRADSILVLKIAHSGGRPIGARAVNAQTQMRCVCAFSRRTRIGLALYHLDRVARSCPSTRRDLTRCPMQGRSRAGSKTTPSGSTFDLSRLGPHSRRCISLPCDGTGHLKYQVDWTLLPIACATARLGPRPAGHRSRTIANSRKSIDTAWSANLGPP